MNGKNRSEGWKSAKLLGHKNEEIISEKLKNNLKFRQNLFNRLNIKDKFKDIFESGLNEKSIYSILGDKIKKKSDITIILENDNYLNLSIKKSKSGQVHFITVDRFIDGFEMQFKKVIPEKIKKAIHLFWGLDYENYIIEDIIIEYGTNPQYENRKHRIVAETLESYDSNLNNSLINWFKENIYEITLFCFSIELVKENKYFAEYIWYTNFVDDENLDIIFNIKDIAELSKKYSNKICYGKKNGGSTISLPFGFVQWHQGKIQFHHNLESIQELFKNL